MDSVIVFKVVLQNIQIFTFDHLKECGRDVANFLL